MIYNNCFRYIDISISKKVYKSILFLLILQNSIGQKSFTYDFKHGTNDNLNGRITYQIILNANGEELVMDSKSVAIYPESLGEQAKVMLLINSVDLAYKDKSLESKSQDKEAEVFYLGFEEPKSPAGGALEYISSPKLYDRKTSAGATKSKISYSYICNSRTQLNSFINVSFKIFFAPRGRNEVIDSKDHSINIPVVIDPPKSVYVDQLRVEKAFEKYKILASEISNDPKRRNLNIMEKIKQFLGEYKDIKHDKISELGDVLKQYENRTLGPDEVYERIMKFKEADMLQKASGDINLYINNCVQRLWDNCPELEEVRYLEAIMGRSDTMLLRGFLNKYPSSSHAGELYARLQELRANGQHRSSSGGGGYNSYGGGSSPFNSEGAALIPDSDVDSLYFDTEPAGADVEYKEALRRIAITKTGNWDNVDYFYELVGDQGRLGKKVLGSSKREVVYLDDLDAITDNYKFELFKREGNGKYQLIHDTIQFSFEGENKNNKYIMYSIIAVVAAALFYIYYNYLRL
jgi:hypothetical protein